jgi:MFS transporter, DHA1 family, multidrug resistance protein
MTASTAKSGPTTLVALLGILTALDAIAIDIYMPALAALERALSLSNEQAQWILSIFLLGLTLGQLIWGPLSDRYGRRPPLLCGLVIFTIGSLLPLTVAAFPVLLAGRSLQALGASAALVIARAIVVDRFAKSVVAHVLSLLMQILGLSAIVSPLVGAALLGCCGWRSTFLALGIIGVACLLGVAFLLGESLRHADREPLSLPTQYAGYRALLTDLRFVAFALALSLSLCAMFIVLTGASLFFVESFGWSTRKYALLYAAASLLFVLGGAANTRLLRRYTPTRVLAYALSAHLGVALLFCVGAVAGVRDGAVAVMILSIFAVDGAVFGNLGALAMQRGEKRAGRASGLLGLSQYGISALGVAVVPCLPLPLLSATGLATALTAFLSLCFFVLGLRSTPGPLRCAEGETA